MKKVSIVIMTYKKFDRFFQTLDSVFLQDYENIEVIIADDGSDNFPQKLLDAYLKKATQQKNIKCFIYRNPKNIGTVKNANKAYKNVSGEYIFNLSCGDIFFERCTVSKLVNQFETKKCDILVASRIMYTGNYEPICLLPHYKERKIAEKKNTWQKQYFSFITSRYYDMYSGSAMYFKKEIIKKYNYYDESFFLWEDGPFIAKYLWGNKICTAYDIISIWYENGGVSTCKEKMNPFLYKDRVLFIEKTEREHWENLNLIQKRIIDYRAKRFLTENKKDLVILRIRNLLPMFLCFEYRMRRKYYAKFDAKILDELLDNDENIIKNTKGTL